MKKYKVLTQKDKWFSGKFDPEKLEVAINAYVDLIIFCLIHKTQISTDF